MLFCASTYLAVLHSTTALYQIMMPNLQTVFSSYLKNADALLLGQWGSIFVVIVKAGTFRRRGSPQQQFVEHHKGINRWRWWFLHMHQRLFRKKKRKTKFGGFAAVPSVKLPRVLHLHILFRAYDKSPSSSRCPAAGSSTSTVPKHCTLPSRCTVLNWRRSPAGLSGGIKEQDLSICLFKWHWALELVESVCAPLGKLLTKLLKKRKVVTWGAEAVRWHLDDAGSRAVPPTSN